MIDGQRQHSDVKYPIDTASIMRKPDVRGIEDDARKFGESRVLARVASN